MTVLKLAAALLRRKELQEKVEILKKLKESDYLYHITGERIRVTEGLDELQRMKFPKLELHQVTSEYDHYARSLRLIDAAIQQANWTCELAVEDLAMSDWKKQEF